MLTVSITASIPEKAHEHSGYDFDMKNYEKLTTFRDIDTK